MPPRAAITFDCLPGYRFLECVGRSPFGETWKVCAPDARLRAVKFVTSFCGREAAITPRELAAAERLKHIRHPGLARVERVENDQGRLLLVGDLPEQSLRDRFEQCRAAGLPGIRRLELLRYLRTAAEALDYLDSQHLLQHLALHPYFNMLIVQEQLQLADFGVVQLMWIPAGQPLAALNPRYSAPEVLGEKLSRSSDQYSLALVFAEMLTGQAPFRGNTARQLLEARQRDLPALDFLPAADRTTVVRALSLDPRRRFPSCTELVGALTAASPEPTAALAGLRLPAAFAPSGEWDPAAAETSPVLMEQVVHELVQQAMSNLAMHDFRGLRYAIGPDGCLRHKCGAWLPAGVAAKKLQGFVQQWRAKTLRRENEVFVFQVNLGGTKSIWNKLIGSSTKDRFILIQVHFKHGSAATSKLTAVSVKMQCLGRSREEGRRILTKMGPLFLDSLRHHLVANSEQRNQERFPFAYPLRVAPILSTLEAGGALECQGKDISYSGIGFYAPILIETEHVYVFPTPQAGLPAFTLPAALVRAQPAGNTWYEIGASFLFSHASQFRQNDAR